MAQSFGNMEKNHDEGTLKSSEGFPLLPWVMEVAVLSMTTSYEVFLWSCFQTRTD